MKKRDNSGSISKNRNKTNPKGPDMKGSANIGGSDYWISGWVKEGEDGKWISLAFDVKEQQRPRKQANDDIEDDLPF